MNQVQGDPGPSFMQQPVRPSGKNLSFASSAPKLASSPGKNLFGSRGGKPRAMCMNSMSSASAASGSPSKGPVAGGKNLSLAGPGSAGGGKPTSAGKNMSLMAKRRTVKPTPQTPASPLKSQPNLKPKCQKPCILLDDQPKTTTIASTGDSQQHQRSTTVQKAAFTAQLANMQSALNAVQTQMHEIKKLYSSQVSHNGLKLKIRRGEGSPSKSSPGNSRKEGCGSSSRKPDSGWGSLLPEAVLAQIFKNLVEIEDGCLPALVRTSKVCRLWRTVAGKPELWTNVDLRKVVDIFRLERNLLFLLENRFSRVRHLNLGIGGWPLSSSMVSGLVTITGKTLQTLQVPGCEKLTAQHLQELSEGCTELKKLDLSGVSTAYNTKSAVNPSALQDAFIKMNERLVHLSIADNCLANCQQIVQSLAENCPTLQVLDLSNVSSPRRDSIQLRLEQLQIGCPNLKVLRLTNTDISLSSRAMEQQSPGFVRLEELSIAVDPRRCQGLDDNDLERIVKGAQGLKLFDVRGCGRISDSAIVRVPAWDLQHLFLSGCSACKSSPDGLELIVRKWRHSFVELDLSWTPSEQTIALALAALSEVECSSLKVLNICGSSVTLPTLKAVLAQCPSLESLNLTSCRALPRGLKRNYPLLEEVVELRKAVEKMEATE